MICTTLNKIRSHSPCGDGWEKLLKYLDKTKADDEPLPLVTVLDSNGLDDCLWCLRTVPEYDHEWTLFGEWCERTIRRLMPVERGVNALDVAERFARGLATFGELYAAHGVTRATADAVWDAARDAARVARVMGAIVAARATGAVAWNAAREAQEVELRRILETN